MADSLRPKWQKVARRKWEQIRDSWLEHVPVFPLPGAAPDPGLEDLQPLLEVPLPAGNPGHARFPDVPGLRQNLLGEAVFLFHKCAHSHLAAQRLGHSGMQSWCMFNAYHSAYIGARGIMSLLGVSLPNLRGAQVLVDVYPALETRARSRLTIGRKFDEFELVRLPALNQRNLWEAFQRVLRITEAPCFDPGLVDEIDSLQVDEITPPRNHFLYKAAFWPRADLITDSSAENLVELSGIELETEADNFLLRLSFVVYKLCEQLLTDLALHSNVIKAQLQASRVLIAPQVAELACYNDFLRRLTAREADSSDR